MSSSPLSIRFDRALLDRLRRTARARDTTSSGLAQRLIDEGLRSLEHPGIIFRDGPSGRRAALAGGPDVWEVVAALKHSTAHGEPAIVATAEGMDLSKELVNIALDYYGSHADEVDAQVVANEQAARDAYAAWRARQGLLA